MSKIVSRKVKNMLVMVIVVFTAIFTPLSSFQAQTYNEFSISPTIPENQIDVSKTYFDLAVAPNQQQELEVIINNSGSEEMVAEISIFSTLTGNNGGLVYTKAGDGDASLEHPITEYATVKTPEVIIPAYASEPAIISLNLGEEQFAGVTLGGIVVKARTVSDGTTNNKEAIEIQNEVAYVVGLKLTMDETSVETNLNLIDTRAELIDYRTSVIANIQNDQPVIMKAATITGEIYKKDSNTAISTVNVANADIAPNTNFNVVFDWNNNQIAEGKYRIHLKIEHLGKIWEWDEEFTVGTEVEAVNAGAFEVNQTLPIGWIIAGIIVVLILILLIIFIILKKKKQEEETEEIAE